METDERIELEVDQEKCAEVEGRQADTQAEIYNIDLDHSSKVLSMQEDTEVQEAVEVVTTAKLITEVVTAAATQEKKGVVIRDLEEELHIDTPAEIPNVKDKGKGILIEDPKPMKKKYQIEMDAEYAKKLQEELEKEHEEAYKQIDWNAAFDHFQAKETQYIKTYHGFKKKPQSESEAHKNMISYLKNTEVYKKEFFKEKTYDQILLIFQARFDANMKFLFKTREEMEKEDEEIIKSINETPGQKAVKRRKLSEDAQEADNLRGRLKIVQDEDDDVFVEAIPLTQKVPVVDYQVVVIDNKPRYKIIRADDTHQFYISFTTLLKNFDREDLETLWSIVKDRFSTKKPTNFSDEYLLLTLKIMFGELDEQDAIWRNQKSVHGLALVKRWKLLTSCGVHVIILSTVQLFLLVKRRYPLSRFTLEKLVNVARLQTKVKAVQDAAAAAHMNTWFGGPPCCKPDTQHCKILCDVVYLFYTGEVVITVILIVVVVVIVVVVFVVTVIESDGKICLPSSGPQFGDNTFYQKLLEFNPSNLSSVQLLRENTDSVRSNQWISPTVPSKPLKLKGTKKSQGSNKGGGNTKDGGKTVGEMIGAGI
nr:hypothetical protein [Tanacetum cinerariifolium]